MSFGRFRKRLCPEDTLKAWSEKKGCLATKLCSTPDSRLNSTKVRVFVNIRHKNKIFKKIIYVILHYLSNYLNFKHLYKFLYISSYKFNNKYTKKHK